MHVMKLLERSKKYLTETEENSSEAQDDKIRLKKDGTPNTKSRFNARKILANMEEQRQKNQKLFLTKMWTWSVACLGIFSGHFYCAIFILWSASVLHKENLTMGHLSLRKE